MDFEILYRLYFRDVYRYVPGTLSGRTSGGGDRPGDLCPALGAVDRFDGRGDVRAWLFTIARNVWVDHCRRHRRETELPGEDLPGGGDFAGALEDREEVLALHRILHTLPEPYKEVFGLRVFGELPFRAIGQVFGKTEGWARVTYYRAKSRILRQWEAERDESEL